MWLSVKSFLILMSSTVFLSGCTHLFFQPMRLTVLTPSELGIDYQEIRIPTSDSLTLNSWLLAPREEHLGNVIFFHGNAENISTHINSVYWLVEYGYQVLLVDYRGYGSSEGIATLEGAIDDISYAMQWFLESEHSQYKPTFIFGQSLGAAMSIYALANLIELSDNVRGYIFEASFASYRQIAREALGSYWLSWPFQYPLSWTIADGYAPKDYLGQLGDRPILLIHSREDEVVGYHHSQTLIEQSGSNNIQHISAEGRHIQSLQFSRYRKAMLAFMDKHSHPN